MIKEHIIQMMEKEIKNRDDEITSLKKKNGELGAIYNDWICNSLTDKKKIFPEEYIKQKKELADIIVDLRNEKARVNEILNSQQENHKKEIEELKFEIKLLQERIPKKSLFDMIKR